jgi:ACS family pantothenate transporter-like MFS transporter
LQAAVYKGLNGVHGKAGWQWLFIMDGVISLPICLLGFFLIPDLPENSRAFYLTEDHRELAKTRMETIGRAPRKKLGWSIIKRVFSRWHVYALSVLYIIFINSNNSSSVNPFSLWLKSKKYSVSLIVRTSDVLFRETRHVDIFMFRISYLPASLQYSL